MCCVSKESWKESDERFISQVVRPSESPLIRNVNTPEHKNRVSSSHALLKRQLARRPTVCPVTNATQNEKKRPPYSYRSRARLLVKKRLKTSMPEPPADQPAPSG